MTNHLIDPSLWPDLEAKARLEYKPNQGLAFGPFLFGYAADGFAFGFLALQILQWYTLSYRTETRIVRAIVIWTLLLSTLYTALSIRYMLNLFAYGFDVYRNFYNFSWVSTFLLLSGFIQTPISCFFAHRAYIFTGRSKAFAWTTFPIIVVTLVICITLKATAPPVWTEHLLAQSRLALTVVRDTIISGTITWALVSGKTDVQAFEKTDKWAKKAVIIFIEAQYAATLFALAFVISFIAIPRSNLTAFFMCTPKAYAVTVMGALNGRILFKRDLIPANAVQLKHPFFGVFNSCASGISCLLPHTNKRNQNQNQSDSINATQTEIHVETETIQQTSQLEPLQVKQSVNRDPKPYSSPYSLDLGGMSLHDGVDYYGHRSRKRDTNGEHPF
uniref:DUF6534 domain-containing protein n=1 Tax=Kwoniella pini CBS 10737 TaxID=1296096 RepID=A0A1B9IAZ8_9TREE|nr:uncharacterized protein I206_00005 [Kwoniella pini CBS 10737]OCF52709.1 hypothetical protein I206_00005 [Kwoniella pini CBS 10737]